MLATMRDSSPNTMFIETLVDWARDWRPPNHSVTTHLSPTDRNKTSAWVQADGPLTGGQVTVWDSGECEIEIYDARAAQPRWLEHFEFATPEDFIQVLERFAAALD